MKFIYKLLCGIIAGSLSYLIISAVEGEFIELSNLFFIEGFCILLSIVFMDTEENKNQRDVNE